MTSAKTASESMSPLHSATRIGASASPEVKPVQLKVIAWAGGPVAAGAEGRAKSSKLAFCDAFG
jgi:hypothetical protein